MKAKKIMKIDEELWNKIRDQIRVITKNLDNYDEKYMKIQFKAYDDLPLKKTIELHSMITVVRAAFHEENKHYPQVFLDECWCNL